MKKKILVGVLVLTLVLGAISVYADSPDMNEYGRGYGQMDGSGYGHMNGNPYNQENKRINRSEDNEWTENNRGFCGNQRNLTEEEREEWFQETQEERSEYREESIKRDLENGIIDQDQADKWRAHFAERDEFHKENGYRDECCQGGGRGRSNNNNHHMNNGNKKNSSDTNNNSYRNGNSNRRGHGNGMMGGYNY